MLLKWRYLATVCFFVSLVLIVLLRLFYVALPNASNTANVPVRAVLRGSIFDRYGKTLALNHLSYSIVANPKLFDLKDIPTKMNLLAQELSLSKNQLAERIRLDRSFNWLKRKISAKQAHKIQALKMKGIYLKKEYKRIYPHKYRASHVLGFTDPSLRGIEGIEYTFNTLLQGETSRAFTEHMHFGFNLHLTLDHRIQDIVREKLRKSVLLHKAQSGSVIIMDASNGEILSLANYPDYDNNKFSKYPLELYRNTAVVSYYEPGSVIKPIIASIALEEKIIQENELIYCPKSLTIQDRKIKRSVKKNYATLKTILQKSCNVGIIQIARRIPQRTFHEYLRRYGFGRKTGIQLSGEGRGVLKEIEQFTQDSQLNMAFGYEIGATPLQLTVMMATLANGGIQTRPQILHKITDITQKPIEKPRKAFQKRIISKSTADRILKILESVVSRGGTASQAEIQGFPISGKTGTTQIFNSELGSYDQNNVNTAFIGIIPQYNTRLVCFVFLQRPLTKQFAGTVAVPLFREILEVFLHKGIVLRNN